MRAARQGTRRDRARGVRRGGGGSAEGLFFSAQTPRRNGSGVRGQKSSLPNRRRGDVTPAGRRVGARASSARRAPSSAATNARIGHSRGAEPRARRSRARARAPSRDGDAPRGRRGRAPSLAPRPRRARPRPRVAPRSRPFRRGSRGPSTGASLPLARRLGALAGRDGPRPTRAREAGVARSPRRVRRLDQREARAPGVRGRGQTPRAPRREAAGRRGEARRSGPRPAARRLRLLVPSRVPSIPRRVRQVADEDHDRPRRPSRPLRTATRTRPERVRTTGRVPASPRRAARVEGRGGGGGGDLRGVATARARGVARFGRGGGRFPRDGDARGDRGGDREVQEARAPAARAREVSGSVSAEVEVEVDAEGTGSDAAAVPARASDGGFAPAARTPGSHGFGFGDFGFGFGRFGSGVSRVVPGSSRRRDASSGGSLGLVRRVGRRRPPGR